MCNVSDYIEEKGIEKGSNQQIQLFVTTLLKNNFSVDSIIDLIAQSNHITREAAEVIVKNMLPHLLNGEMRHNMSHTMCHTCPTLWEK